MHKAVWQEGVRDFEVAGLHQFLICENSCRIALGNEPAVVQNENTGAEIQHHLQVVARKHPGVLKAVELMDELAARFRVQVR